jgi:CDP-glucose 4,6-dehydratase
MVKIAIQSWGSGEYESLTTGSELHEAGLLQLDISKACAELKWKPRMNAYEAVKLTMDWYKQYFEDVAAIIEKTESQIHSFISVTEAII